MDKGKTLWAALRGWSKILTSQEYMNLTIEERLYALRRISIYCKEQIETLEKDTE